MVTPVETTIAGKMFGWGKRTHSPTTRSSPPPVPGAYLSDVVSADNAQHPNQPSGSD
jgi:hypothetical protein